MTTCDAEIAIVLDEPGDVVHLLGLGHVSGPVAGDDGLLERGDQTAANSSIVPPVDSTTRRII